MAGNIPWTDTVLWMNARVLALGGMWRPPWFQPKWYLLYRAWVLFTQFSFLFAQVQALWFFWGNIDKITHDTCLLITTILGLVKFFTFVLRQEDFFRMVQKIDDSRAEQSKSGDSEIVSILDASYRSARTITLYMTFLGGSSPGVWAIIPTILRRLGVFPPERELPATAWYSRRDTETPYYQMLCTLQYFSMQYSFFMAMCLDLFFVCIIIHAAGQLEVLNARFRRVGQIAGNHSADSHKQQKALEEFSGDVFSPEEIWEDLCDCIKQHQDIIELIKEIERLLSKIVLLQFLGATVIICVTLFQSSKNTDNIAALLLLQAYLGVVIYEIFMYCWYADDILYQSSRLAMSAYACNWPGAPPQLQRALVFIIRRTQRPLGLTAGKFYYVSRETFVRLMSASYSYYALLNQVNDK
uniref:Odorant receptor n=1 Tax=Locusta migratoria TaxID=7004 RepID=A0A0M4JMM9_LOCMI|nr:odorant receptor 34 [Locusta migratoria]